MLPTNSRISFLILTKNPMIFLIADDSAPMRSSIKRFLSARIPDHHSITEVADGGEAITAFGRIHPDWVLMDIKMEPIDGITASRSIMRTHPEAKIVVLTNYDDARYRRAAYDAGARAFLAKDRLDDLRGILGV